MCRIIIINRGEKEISTPREFFDHFGFLPAQDVDMDELDLCLCGYDVEKTLIENDVCFKECNDDLFVGELDLITITA